MLKGDYVSSFQSHSIYCNILIEEFSLKNHVFIPLLSSYLINDFAPVNLIHFLHLLHLPKLELKLLKFFTIFGLHSWNLIEKWVNFDSIEYWRKCCNDYSDSKSNPYVRLALCWSINESWVNRRVLTFISQSVISKILQASILDLSMFWLICDSLESPKDIDTLLDAIWMMVLPLVFFIW